MRIGKIIKKLWIIALALIVVVAGIAVYVIYFSGLPKSVKVYDIVRLNKEWTEEERQWYYHTSQGSEIMPYDWFVAMEQPDNKKLFIDNDHMTQFRFIPDPNTLYNPDLLPVGFAKDDPDPVTGIQNIGLTCAACHTTQINHKGMGIRIDGGSGMVNSNKFLERLIISMTVTPVEPSKFARFAKRVLKKEYTEAGADSLKNELIKLLKKLIEGQLQQIAMDKLHGQSPTVQGFGRVDALGAGGNTLYGKIDTKNLRALNAPVVIFPLWYTHQYDWVQSNGSIHQPMSRNIIEALAVSSSLVFPGGDSRYPRYLSSARLKNCYLMEELISKLKAPVWPEHILGEIDREKVKRGKDIYKKYCVSCHGKILESTPKDSVAARYDKRYYILRLFPFEEIGTDTMDAANFANRTLDATKIGLKKDEPGATVIAMVLSGIEELRYDELKLPLEEQYKWNGYRALELRAPKAYPARPLAGIWATAPFLHNGSVPNLYQLLLPAEERDETFYLGDLEFDPKNVGYVTDKFKGGFKFDVSKTGNSNSGHEYGT